MTMKSPQTKWTATLEAALAELSAGTYTPGMRYYTMEQFCDKYQISEITGRRVFQELKQRGLISTNGRGGTRVTGYNEVTEVFMCLKDELVTTGEDWVKRYQTLQLFLAGFNSGAVASHYQVTPIPLRFFRAHIDSFIGKPMIVSAIVLLENSSSFASINHALLHDLLEKTRPVFFQRFETLPGATQVGVDRYAGIRKAVAHLANAGHTRIGYLTGSLDCVWFHARFKGFVDGLYEASIALEPAFVAITSGMDKMEDIRALQGMLRHPQPPTAMVCANDSRALHLLEYCREQHIAVPQTLAVVGYDNTAESALSQPALTTVDVNDYRCGQVVLDLLHQQQTGGLTGPQDVVIEPELIVRDSG